MIIEKGAYGCVIKPSIPCKKYYEESVSKLFHKDEYFEEEKEISNILLKVDPKNKFTFKKLDECKVSNISKKDRKSCKYLSSDFPKYQIIYEYGGIDLSKFIQTDYSAKSIIPAIINLAYGLVELEKNRLCHRDIKESNILFKDGLFYFIDFGLMLSYDRLYDNDQDYVLKYNYCYYPPEFKIYYDYKFATNNLSSIENIQKFVTNDVKLNYTRSEIVFDNKLINKTVKHLLSSKSLNLLKIAMIHHANRVDIFGIGVVLMKVLLHSNDKQIELKLKLFEIIRKCVELNPYRRITPSQLYKELNTVYK
jgi:serine/threonine protein kinase